jgi:hypothetical protein
MAHSVEYWQNVVMSRLPPPEHVVAGNHEITAQYAHWYQTHPGLFKWAGMAAFASYRVGIALLPYRIESRADRLLSVEAVDGTKVSPARLPDLDLLRIINRAVYQDIGWAHEAYAQAGFEEVQGAAADRPEYQQIYEGFRLIDRGRRLQEIPHHAAEGCDLVWKGNQQLLHHEQSEVIQPRLRDLREDFVVFLSAMTILEFWIDPLGIYPDRLTCFLLAMAMFGKHVLLRTRSLPDFRVFEQRWFWITHRAFPLWRRLETAGDPEALAGIAHLVQAGPGPVARVHEAQRTLAATSSSAP